MDLPEDQESMESSSDSGSEEEEEVEGEVTKPGSGSPVSRGMSELEEAREGSSGPEEDESDGEMSSAVASASQQASKFLQDSDSDEEKANEPTQFEQRLVLTKVQPLLLSVIYSTFITLHHITSQWE